MLLREWGERQFWWQIAPFRYEKLCKAEDVRTENEECAEEAHIHYFRLKEIPYSGRPEQLNLFILSGGRLSSELITTDKHLVGRKYQALKAP